MTYLAAGTIAIFKQTTAPVGWIKLTNISDATLRIVSGNATSGGSVNFSSFYTGSKSISAGTAGASTATGRTDGTGLSVTQLPSHGHSFTVFPILGRYDLVINGPPRTIASIVSGSTNAMTSGPGHSHAINFSSWTANSTTTLNFNIKYVDVIRAERQV